MLNNDDGVGNHNDSRCNETLSFKLYPMRDCQYVMKLPDLSIFRLTPVCY